MSRRPGAPLDPQPPFARGAIVSANRRPVVGISVATLALVLDRRVRTVDARFARDLVHEDGGAVARDRAEPCQRGVPTGVRLVAVDKDRIARKRTLRVLPGNRCGRVAENHSGKPRGGVLRAEHVVGGVRPRQVAQTLRTRARKRFEQRSALRPAQTLSRM